MNLILFDLGGTLIDDPFSEVLKELGKECFTAPQRFYLEKPVVAEFLQAWREQNYRTDFPFASHFLQEESWLTSSLMQLNRSKGVPDLPNLPLASLEFLRRYREIARTQIRSQNHLPRLRKTLSQLKKKGVKLGVASNDREYATRAMLSWADIAAYFDVIFTSEQLSRRLEGAYKPRSAFFNAILNEIKELNLTWEKKIFVGDSERNDISPARAAGFETIRFINRRNPKDAIWIDKKTETVAGYSFEDRRDLLKIIVSILG